MAKKKYEPKTKEERDVKIKEYEQKIAEKFIKAIEEEQAPWQKPWDPNINAIDHNPTTDKTLPVEEQGYHGLNSMILEITRLLELHTDDPRWITSAQIWELNQNKENQDNKIYIKKGEHATTICKFVKTFFDKDKKPIKDPELLTPENISFAKTGVRYFQVFNYSQLVRYKKDENGKSITDENGNPVTEPAFDPPEKNTEKFKPRIAPEKLIKNTGAKIKHDQVDSCFYREFDDTIHLVVPERFKSQEDYYGTVLHELTHWTGAEKRLGREEFKKYGENKEWRAKEELVAEIGSYLLSKKCRLTFEPRQDSKSYIQSWCKAIKDAPSAILNATMNASVATNYIADFSRKERTVSLEKEAARVEEGNLSLEKKTAGKKR